MGSIKHTQLVVEHTFKNLFFRMMIHLCYFCYCFVAEIPGFDFINLFVFLLFACVQTLCMIDMYVSHIQADGLYLVSMSV